MSAEKALALVVRGSDWSETSRITTLFTREFGKVRALAKGGRRLKSSFEIAFDLLTLCRVVFLRNRSGGLDLLTEAQLTERFPDAAPRPQGPLRRLLRRRTPVRRHAGLRPAPRAVRRRRGHPAVAPAGRPPGRAGDAV